MVAASVCVCVCVFACACMHAHLLHLENNLRYHFQKHASHFFFLCLFILFFLRQVSNLLLAKDSLESSCLYLPNAPL